MNPTELVRTYAAVHRNAPGVVTELTPELREALEAWRQGLPSADPGGADLAETTVELLEQDPVVKENLAAMRAADPQRFGLGLDPASIGLTVAALIALQSYVRIERDKDGKWSFKFEKKPLDGTLLGAFLKKLLGG